MNDNDAVTGNAGSSSARDGSETGSQLTSVLSELRISPNSNALTGTSSASTQACPEDISYRPYYDEDDIQTVMDLIAPYLSEPYSIYCYRYFLHGWPHLCLLAQHGDRPVGVVVCKQEKHGNKLNRGYIAMLSTRPEYRKLGIASTLVEKATARMTANGAQEIMLETEVSNAGALRLYARLGFIREKRLYRFYLNASDAFRLCLPIEEPVRDDA